MCAADALLAAGNARDTRCRADAIKAQANAMIAREIVRCRAIHGPASWEEHGAWVTENIIASAKCWLIEQARKGEL